MESSDFWRLIESAGGVRGFHEEGGRQRLVESLSAKQPTEIEAFADVLSKLLYDLDLRELARQPVVDAVEERRPKKLSSDGFLYARCAVVLSGHTSYTEVMNDHEKFAPYTSLYNQYADQLLEVASDAYQASTGQEWEHDEPYDYESGSNVDGWRSSQ